MKSELNINDDLLVKYMLGEANATEIQQAEQWINRNSNNKKNYNDLRLLWDNSKPVAASNSIDTDAAWARFKHKTQRQVIPIASNNRYNWLKIAALLLILVGGGFVAVLTRKNDGIATKMPTYNTLRTKINTEDKTTKIIDNEQDNKIVNKNYSVESKSPILVETRKNKTKNDEYKKGDAHKYIAVKINDNKAKSVICNSTPSPIEICITQTIKCNGQPSTVSTCSTLEPDHEGKLHYTSHDKIGKHCTMSIDEITIKTMSTGETIVLNEHSTPSTAQDFFKYITGQKKGDAVAGVFRENCDDNQDCGLKFDNNFGDLILQ